MVRSLSLLFAILLAAPAPAAYISNSLPNGSVGMPLGSAIAAINVSDLSKLRTLSSSDGSSTADNYLNLTRMGSQGTNLEGYQVASTGSLECAGFWISNGGSFQFNFGYGTAALASNDTATPPTGVKVFTNVADRGILTASSTAYVYYPFPVSFPAGSYPFVKQATSAVEMHIHMVCVQL